MKTAIFLADDDPDDALIFEMALQETGAHFLFRHTQNYSDLFELLREQLPDFLFLDIIMPGRDGITCVTEIRSDRRFDKMVVIMYSSMTHDYFINETYRRGADFFLEKTASLNELTEKISEILGSDRKQQFTLRETGQFVL